MKAHSVWWLVVLAILKNVSCSEATVFELVTTSLTAKEGSCVEISCRVNGRVKAAGAHWFWIKDVVWSKTVLIGTVIYSMNKSLIPVSTDFADRVKGISSLLPASGGYLTISKKSSILLCNLKKSDNGKYFFRFDGEEKWYTDPVILYVKDNPCLITFQQPPVFKENDTATLTCSTLSSCGLNPVIKSSSPRSPTSHLTHPQESRNQKSTSLSFTVNWQHDGEEFSCQTDDSDRYLIRNISLTVEYAPRDTQAEKHPADVVEGGSVTLKCVANGRPDPNFTWFGNENKEIGRGAEHKITLIVESQSGEYHCEATNKLGTMKSNPVNINVTYRPEVEVSMSPTATVRQGDVMTLTCRVRRSNPLPHTFTWFKDEKALSEERTERYVVQSIQPEDAGVYKCSAINVRGEGTSVPFRVKVQYGPRRTNISISEDDERVGVGKSLTFYCQTEANPSPLGYSWYRDNEIMEIDSSRWKYETTRDNKRTLVTVERTDEGCYTCKATNFINTGKQSEPVCIEVLYAPTSPSLSMKTEVREGQLVSISCSVESSPPSKLTLTLTSESNPPSSKVLFTHPGSDRRPNNLYHTFHVTYTHAGFYTCDATNTEGSMTSERKKLEVKYSPKDVSVIARPSLVVEEKEPLTLECSARSDPPVTSVTWRKMSDGATEILGKTQTFSLKSVGPSDSGQYSCEASNDVGTGNSPQTELRIKYAPKLTKITETEHWGADGTSSVTLSCSSHSYPPITQYLWYKENHKAANKKVSISDHQNYTVYSDQPGSYYCVATNDIHQRASSPVHLFERNVLKTVLIILFIVFLLTIFLIVVVYRQKRKRSSEQAATNTFGFLWEPIQRWWNSSERNRTNGRGAEDDLCPDRPKAPRCKSHPDSTPAANIHSIYCTVNEPSGQHGPPALNGITEKGVNTPEDSLNYASVHFGKINQRAKAGEDVYAKVSKQKPPKKSEERQEDYENASSAHLARDPDPWSYDTDSSEEEVEVHYSQVTFAAKPGRGGGGWYSSSSEGDETQYSEVKV
uniref:B-cell receptor CD22 isoform X1 n=1 Tax=Gasterosteus aculeatus aculeatus TaxID=481459 RepID=UPI001A984C5E|nr:B-cell receptor CD22 isoform X1 [Gasterosteus aculeatus aculeatus]